MPRCAEAGPLSLGPPSCTPHTSHLQTTGGNGGINVYKYHYPEERVVKDAEGIPRGVAGRAELLNARVVSSQPLVAWDWSPDKEGLAVAAALDQTLRVFIVTKLHKY